MKKYYVYILTNKPKGVLYVGITNNLYRRVYEHKKKLVIGFTQKYNLKQLVFFEETNDVSSALQREKQLKNWHRQWKINLIEEANPAWKDLAYLLDPEINSG
jgi:putative endonuclease